MDLLQKAVPDNGGEEVALEVSVELLSQIVSGATDVHLHDGNATAGTQMT